MKVLKSLLISFIFLYSLIAFLPKEKVLNYLLLKSNQPIKLQYTTFDDNFLTLQIHNLKPYFNNIKICKVNKLKTIIFLFDNNIYIHQIIVSDEFKDFIPNIKNMIIRYNILNPKQITIKANFIGAKIQGFVDIFEKKLILNLVAKNQFKHKYKLFIKKFKKTKQGLRFEYNF